MILICSFLYFFQLAELENGAAEAQRRANAAEAQSRTPLGAWWEPLERWLAAAEAEATDNPAPLPIVHVGPTTAALVVLLGHHVTTIARGLRSCNQNNPAGRVGERCC